MGRGTLKRWGVGGESKEGVSKRGWGGGGGEEKWDGHETVSSRYYNRAFGERGEEPKVAGISVIIIITIDHFVSGREKRWSS